jgi:hypothetical protein
LDILQHALHRAVERHNMTRFTPVGRARELVITELRRMIEAIAEGNTTQAAAIHDQIQPESPDTTPPPSPAASAPPLVCSTTGSPAATRKHPKNLGQRVPLPAGHWLGARAATDILVLARKRRAFRSLDTLITEQGEQHLPYGRALALAATIQTWSAHTGTPVTDLTHTAVH